MLSLIAEIDEFKGAWRAIGRIAPERLLKLRRVATIGSIGSSTRIEGAKLTDREVEKLLSNLHIGSFTSRDEEEVAGYAQVMETIFSAADAIRLEAFDADGNSLGVVFRTATPFETPQRMEALVSWVHARQEVNDLHPLLVIAVFVVVFLEIHPFQHGNGRLSRVLTTLLLLQAGYAYVPFSSLESVIEQSKEGYDLALRRTQGTIRTAAPDWTPWVEFFLRALQRQKQR